jgi:type I restriction enzyme S subunit
MEYNRVQLSDVAEILVGFAFKSDAFNIDGIGIRLVRGKNITSRALRWGDDTRWWNDFTLKLDRYYLQENDIVIGMDGSLVGKNYARIYAEDLPLLLVQRVACIRAKEGVDQDYLWSCIASSRFEQYIDAVKTGTSIPHISGKQIGEYEIPLLTLDDQKKIGTIATLLEEKIRCNNKINDNLQQQLTAIFREWFVDAPESAEWPRGTFADLIDHTISGDWGKETPTGNYTEMVYCIRGADIPEVKIGNKGKMPMRFILPKNYTAKKLVDGDIVVEISGGSPTQSTGRAAPVSESLLGRYDRGMICTNFCKAIKPKQGYSMFVYHYWQHLYDAGVFFSYENGTTGIKNLDISGFIETEEIVIPPIEIVSRFDAVCQSIANMVYANGLENERLANMRDTLLPKLMSGEIDVASIEI